MKIAQKIAISYLRQSIRLTALVSPRAAAGRAFRIFCTPLRQKARKPAVVFDHAESLSVQVDNKVCRGFRWNAGGEKKILILHGMHSRSRNFDRYVQPLVEKGCEVIAFDAPGHGESDGNQVTVIQYRQMITEIYSRFGPIDGYLAHSFGGLAISLALENIPNDANTRLVLIAPAVETVTAINHFFQFLNLNGKTREYFDEIILTQGGQPPSWFSVARAIKNIQANILWFQDKGDDITPIIDMQPIVEAAYPRVEFVITENLGHRRIYKDQKIINRAVDFLATAHKHNILS